MFPPPWKILPSPGKKSADAHEYSLYKRTQKAGEGYHPVDSLRKVLVFKNIFRTLTNERQRLCIQTFGFKNLLEMTKKMKFLSTTLT